MKTKREKALALRTTFRSVTATAMLAALLAACGGGDGTAASPAAASPQLPIQVAKGVWVVMGSSTAAGAGARSGNGWAALLQRAYESRGVQIANIAKGGSVTYEGRSVNAAQVAQRPAADPNVNVDQALSRRPVLLIVSYPTNDTAKGYGVDEIVNNVLEIRGQALAAGVPVLVTSTQPRNLLEAKLAQLSAIDQRLAAAVGPCFVEVRQALAGPNGQLAPAFDSGDGTHLNDAGHQQIFSKLRESIDSGLCVKISSS